MATYVYRTPGSTFTGEKYTFSGWFKRGNLDARNCMLWASSDGGSADFTEIEFKADGTLHWGNKPSSGTNMQLVTNRVFKDPAAWYHLVFTWDTTLSAGDRAKIYVNGVEETSFSTDSNAGSGETGCSLATSGVEVDIGKQTGSTNYYYGEMSHLHLCIGYAYAASDFGEFDSTSGIWKIDADPSVTHGTNGWFLKMEDRTNLDLDSSANTYTFTTSGTLTATYDNPSNNFATWNPLHNTGATMSNGNTTALSTDANFIAGVSTLGVAAGKWYSEFKLNAEGASGESVIGVTALVRPTSAIAGQTGNFGMRNDNGTIYYTSGGSATTDTSQHSDFTTSDIIGVALDMDLGRLYFSKNGGWWNGAATWGAATPSSYITLQTDIYDEFFFEGGDAAGSQDASWQANFGNGYFGTTAVSSAQADDAGIGAMEYDVPAGYYCLCTKNIKAYGG